MSCYTYFQAQLYHNTFSSCFGPRFCQTHYIHTTMCHSLRWICQNYFVAKIRILNEDGFLCLVLRFYIKRARMCAESRTHITHHSVKDSTLPSPCNALCAPHPIGLNSMLISSSSKSNIIRTLFVLIYSFISVFMSIIATADAIAAETFFSRRRRCHRQQHLSYSIVSLM